MRAEPAREEALRILLRVSEEGAWASRLLDALDEKSLDPRDLALIQQIVLGVLRWRGALDDALAQCVRRPIAGLDPAVREALRMGAYQILFLDRVPAHAAVGASVDLTKRALGPGAAGFVNAVLRRVAAKAAPRTDAASGTVRMENRSGAGRGSHGAAGSRLAAELSHPLWLVERALARFGDEEARAHLLANNLPAPVTLRPNPLHPDSVRLAERLAREGVRTEPCGLAPGALRVIEGRPVRTGAFAEGAFWIQDEAAQIVPLLFPLPWTGITADFCAAPGGKTLVLATGPLAAGASEDLEEPAGAVGGMEGEHTIVGEMFDGPREALRVVAFDLHPHRLARLAENARRVAPGRVAAVAGDLASASPVATPVFDRVLVDAPCSGTGVLRRHPEIRWRLAPERLGEFAALQGRLLDSAYAALRPGGSIVYAVCSLEPEEGDRVVAAFLSRSGARRLDPRAHVPRSVHAAIDEEGFLRTFPHRHGADGFFAALMQKPAPIG